MKNEEDTKFIRDLALRSCSLILFSVLIGLSIQFGIQKILEPRVQYGVFLNFLTFLVTAIRFFHGNHIFHEKPRREHPTRFMINLYFNVSELIVLCMVGRLINEALRFLYALLLLSIIDIAWCIVSIILSKPEEKEERHVFRVWEILNALSAIFVTTLLLLGYRAVGRVSIIILSVYLLMAVLDYRLCREYYFGRTS